MSRGSVAPRVGMTERRLKGWEDGDVGGASIAKIAALAKVLRIDPRELLDAAFEEWRAQPGNEDRAQLLVQELDVTRGPRVEQRGGGGPAQPAATPDEVPDEKESSGRRVRRPGRRTERDAEPS